MTSNLGSQLVSELAERRAWSDVGEAVTAALRDHCRPEFPNRVDEAIVLRPLPRRQVGAIVDIQVRRLEQRLAERKIGLVLTDAARAPPGGRGRGPPGGGRAPAGPHP